MSTEHHLYDLWSKLHVKLSSPLIRMLYNPFILSPCKEVLTMAHIEAWSCCKVGSGLIEGRFRVDRRQVQG